MKNKINKFHKITRIPEEFFHILKPFDRPKQLPLIIIRMNYFFLSAFIQDFFETMSSEGGKLDMLDYFTKWMEGNPHVTKNRIAYILAMDKDLNGSTSQYDQLTLLVARIGVLFA